jgi:prevent-host-death family protein
MKSINVTELKAHLSRYLRMASRGSRIVVRDRNQPLAVLGPMEREAPSWRERLEGNGRLRRGSQDWGALAISPLPRHVDIQASLSAVREDPDEVRRR